MKVILKEVLTGLPDKVLNIDGITVLEKFKHGFKSKKTISGRTKQKWVERFSRIELQINYLDQDGYDILEEMWDSTNDIICITERGEEMIVFFPNDTLKLSPQYDLEGKAFYTGSLILEE